MEIYPVRAESIAPQRYKFIEWMIHSVCNYDCSFCEVWQKDGKMRAAPLEKNKEYIDKIFAKCEGFPVWFSFTGGEPTLYPHLIELAKYVKSKGAFVSIISNGSRTIRYWKQVQQSKAFDIISITYQSEQTSDYKHVTEVLNLFHDEPVRTICQITHTEKTYDLALEAKKYLMENTGAIVSIKAMFFKEYSLTDFYTEEQIQEYNKSYAYGNLYDTKMACVENPYMENEKVKIIFNDASEKIVRPQYAFKNNLNNYQGWSCDIGTDTLRINGKKIYRGACMAGGPTQTLDDDFDFYNEPILCPYTSCKCACDLRVGVKEKV